MREKCFAQEQNTLTWPGYKCRPLDTESNTGQVTNADLLTLSPAQARLQMQTPKPWVHLTNHKATMSPQEGRVYAESFLISNKFYKTKVKFSYLIFKGDYRSKLIKYVFINFLQWNQCPYSYRWMLVQLDTYCRETVKYRHQGMLMYVEMDFNLVQVLMFGVY